MAEPPLPPDVWGRTPPEAQALILALLAEVRRLAGRVAELERRLGADSTDSHKPPSADPPSVERPPPRRPTGRKPGGQPGHRRHVRPLLPADHALDVRPDSCRRCGRGLAGDDPAPLRHQVWELPELKPSVTESRLHRLGCPGCGATTRAALPPAARHAAGPRLQAACALLTGGYRLSRRSAAALLRDLLGVPLGPAWVCELARGVAPALAEPVAQARAAVAASDVNVDETGWRLGRKRAWLWVAVCATATVFLVRRSRGRAVLNELLGPNHAKVVTSDRYSAYSALPADRRQLCWAHLLRDFQSLVDAGGPGAAVGEELLGLARGVLKAHRRVRDGTEDRARLRKRVRWLRPRFELALCRGHRAGGRAGVLCGALLARFGSLWAFARAGGVGPTNDAAERALRHGVPWRKGSFGTQSESGARFAEAVLTVRETCRQQGKGLLGFVAECVAAHRNGTQPPDLVTPVAASA